MNITIVTFMAFALSNSKIFIDKTYEQIHAELMDICNTYDVLSIIECTGEFVELSNLKNITRHAD